MRNNDPIFWPNSDLDVSLRQSMEKNYTDCINILQTQWYQGDLDQRFAMGDQDLWGLIFPGVATYRRKIFNFNLINSHLQMISGYQRRNRKSTIVIPTQDMMQKTADQLTKCMYYIHDRCNGYQVYSDAFEQGALTQGIGLISIFKDTCSDPVSGDIRLRYVDFKSVLIDPYFRRHDLSDCRFIWTRQFFDREEASNYYPQFRDDIMSMPKGGYRDDKFYYMPEVYQIQTANLVAMDEYWYMSTREATYIIDTETNEIQEFHGDEEDMRILKQSLGNKIAFKTQPKQTVRRSIIVNDRVLLDEPNPYKIDRYPYVPTLGYFTPDTPYYAYKFRGVVRDLRDAQYLFNRRKVADLDILEAQQQGLKVKKGALVTPTDSLNQGNGRVLTIDDKYQMSDVEPMPIIPPAPSMLEMENMLSEVMSKISGVNETMLGTDISDKAGIISMLRNSAGITTLTRLFDQFDESQRLVGSIIVEMIQKNWTYGKVRQVIGEEPTSEFDNKAFFQYGCKVVQGALTETQNQLQLQQLLYFKETTGIDIPPEVIIRASTLQNKDELVEAITQREKAAQEQQQKMMELQMKQMEVDNYAKISYAHSQEGLTAERVNKIHLDKALSLEREKRAKQDETGAVLNLIKALKELEGMDLNHIEQHLRIINTINPAAESSIISDSQKPVSQQQMPINQEQTGQQQVI